MALSPGTRLDPYEIILKSSGNSNLRKSMLTRREILVGVIAAGAILRRRKGFAKASQPATPVNFDVPDGACDCHTHIHGNPEKFPFFSGRVYTPEMALPEEMSALHKALHIERVVIVTPSVYGTDNSATLYGIKARGADARGVAVIDDKTPESELDAMGRAGVCGIRLNLATGGTNDPVVGRQQFQAAVERVKNRNWHVQVYTNLPMISAIKDRVTAAPVPVVFDHFGGARAELGPQQPGFAELVELVRSGKAYVKISGAYRISKIAPDYPDVVPLAAGLRERFETNTIAAGRPIDGHRLAALRHKIIFGIFGIDPHFNGMSPYLHVLLFKGQFLAQGKLYLGTDDINAGYHFRNGMFYLDPGVNFHEIEVHVLVDQEFDGSGVCIVGCPGSFYSCVANIIKQRLIFNQ